MIAKEQVEAIAASLQDEAGGSDIESMLRAKYPDVRFTFCGSDDIYAGTPVAECGAYNLYLYGGEHCLALTNDFESAHGVVVVDVEDE